MTLLELLQLMRKHLKMVITLPVFCALVVAAIAFAVLPNQYTATVSMYVLTQASQSEGGIASQDLTASQMLANDVAKLADSDRVRSDTAKALGMEDLNDFGVRVESDNTTRVMNLSVTGANAQQSAVVANQMAKTVNDVAVEVMNVESINVIDNAQEPSGPSGPPRLKYVVVAFLAGLFLAIAIVAIMDMLNMRVRTPEEVEEMLGIPVIGRIPKLK